MYDKVNPEFKNEDVYADWMTNKTKRKQTDEAEDLANYFKGKYFGQSNRSDNSTAQFQTFGELSHTLPKSLENSSVISKIVYDFRFLMAGGFLALSIATFVGVLYETNKEKKKIKKMNTFREGKGIIMKLTPLNPV